MQAGLIRASTILSTPTHPCNLNVEISEEMFIVREPVPVSLETLVAHHR